MNFEEMTVADLMTTALITMRPRDTVGRADVEMKLAGIRHILVVDERNRLQGIVSNRDILLALGRDGARQVVVGEVMTKTVYHVSEETEAHHAAALLLEHKIGCLPVLGEEGQLVGVITESDFVRVAHAALGGESED